MHFRIALALCLLGVVACGQSRSSSATKADAAVAVDNSCRPVGQSVPCTGPAGCQGGQVCGANGAYGKCDCGTAVTVPTCSPVGTIAVCQDAAGCVGAQVCNPDGTFTVCYCGVPPTDAGVSDASTAPTTLKVDAPVADAVLKGTVTFSGTTTGRVQDVSVSVAGGPFLPAEGTGNWKLSYDTRHLANGSASLIVWAHGVGVADSSVVVPVWIDNLDRLVGVWKVRSGAHAGCVVYFFPSGAISDACSLTSSGAISWSPEAGDLVSVHTQTGTQALSVKWLGARGPIRFLAPNNEFVTLDLVQSLDPFSSTISDGGVGDGG